MRRRGGLLTALLLALLGLSATASAQSSTTPDGQIGSIQSQRGTIQFVFSAGNLPSGSTLDPKSVVVTASDGTTLSATATVADTANAPRATVVRQTVLVFDVSGSMAGDGITGARGAAITYAQNLPKDVRIGLVTFSDTISVLLRPTTDRSALLAAVGHVQAQGNTALYDGVISASSLFDGLPANAEKRMLILSDGGDNISKHNLGDTINTLRGAGISADVVAFRLPGNQTALNAMAAGTGGRVLPAGSAQNLAGVFSQAAQEFRQQLLVTATVPPNLANKTTTLTVSANYGTASVSASSTVTLPDAAFSTSAPNLIVSAPAGSASTGQMWLILAVAFIAFLIIGLVALFLPVMAAARANKQARLAEMHRYRVLGALSTAEVVPTPGTGLAPQGGAPTALAERTLSFVDKTVRARGQRERLVSELDRAGMRIRPEEWAVIQVAAILVTGVTVLLISGNFFGLVIGAAVGWIGVRAFITTKISRRQNAFMDQLPDTLQLMASSLRTGFSLNQSLGGVVREGTEPTASEFARALTEVRLGAELEESLDNVAARMKCEDLAWVVIAIRISREVGGNLAEVLGTTVQTMRQRAELRGQVRVLSAEGRVSARILTALPFVVAGSLLIVRPGYLTPLIHSGAGIALLVLGGALLIVGTFWLNRLVKIKV